MRWCATQDGFALAELDLSMRGPGEFFGTRQAGLPDFRVANLVRDRQLLELAKAEAARFATRNCRDGVAEPGTNERAHVWARLKESWQRRYGLVEAGEKQLSGRRDCGDGLCCLESGHCVGG